MVRDRLRRADRSWPGPGAPAGVGSLPVRPPPRRARPGRLRRPRRHRRIRGRPGPRGGLGEGGERDRERPARRDEPGRRRGSRGRTARGARSGRAREAAARPLEGPRGGRPREAPRPRGGNARDRGLADVRAARRTSRSRPGPARRCLHPSARLAPSTSSKAESSGRSPRRPSPPPTGASTSRRSSRSRRPTTRARGSSGAARGSRRPGPSLARRRPRREVERPDRPRGGGSPRRLLGPEAPRAGAPPAAADGPEALQGPGACGLGGGAAGAPGVRRALPRRGDEQGVRPPRRRGRRRRRALRLRLRRHPLGRRPRRRTVRRRRRGRRATSSRSGVSSRPRSGSKLVDPGRGSDGRRGRSLLEDRPAPREPGARAASGRAAVRPGRERRGPGGDREPRGPGDPPRPGRPLGPLRPRDGRGCPVRHARGNPCRVRHEPDLDSCREGDLRDVDGCRRSPRGLELPVPPQLLRARFRAPGIGRTSAGPTSPGAARRSGCGSRRSRGGRGGPT